MAYRVFFFSLLVTTLLATTACNSGRRGGVLPRDTGTTPTDSSMTGDTGIMLMDTGMTAAVLALITVEMSETVAAARGLSSLSLGP